jgi:hypothetical protein
MRGDKDNPIPINEMDEYERARLDYVLSVMDNPASVVLATPNDDGSVTFEALGGEGSQ